MVLFPLLGLTFISAISLLVLGFPFLIRAGDYMMSGSVFLEVDLFTLENCCV